MALVQVIEDFTLRLTTLVCPACDSMFATPTLVGMPEITPQTVIEADLHRVLPDAEIRGALIAICPACNYSAWTTSFVARVIAPWILPSSPNMEPTRKFARAVLTAHKSKFHSLDIALLALNGGWCAREAKQPHERWLKLAVKKLEQALRDETWQDNRPYYEYVAGEMCRQNNDFHGAVRHFNKVMPQIRLPKELIHGQRALAIAGDSHPVAMPSHLVELLFCLRRRKRLHTPQGLRLQERNLSD